MTTAAVVAAGCGASSTGQQVLGVGDAGPTVTSSPPTSSAQPPASAPPPTQQPAEAVPPAQQPPVAVEPFGAWRRLAAGPLVTRGEPLGVWTGTDVIVVGGLLIDRYQVVVDGAAYQPATGQWRTIAPRPNPGRVFAGVWTGSRLIVWGGGGISINAEDALSNGDAYDPATNQWTAIAPNPFRFPALPPTAVWTGSRVLLWRGGIGAPPSAPLGALYDPAADAWAAIPPVQAPGVLSVGTGVWTGKLWAALTVASTGAGGPAVQSVALFDPASGAWKAAPAPPSNISGTPPRIIWTGREVFVLGDTEALAYNPATSKWRKAPGPDLSVYPGIFRTTSLTDGRVVVAVGNRAVFLEIYDAATDRWTPTGPPPAVVPDVSDAAFTAVGRSVFVFGITSNGTMVNPAAPNGAWMWSPPSR